MYDQLNETNEFRKKLKPSMYKTLLGLWKGIKYDARNLYIDIPIIYGN